MEPQFPTPSQEPIQRPNRPKAGWQWVAVVLLAAAVGSASTFAVEYGLNKTRLTASTLGTADSGQSLASSTTTSLPVSKTVNISDAITEVAKAAKPAVMGVVNYQNSPYSFFSQQQSDPQEAGVGTGTLFYKDANYAYIVTNNHVVEGADKVEVVLDGGKHVSATVLGTDPYTDLAVLRIDVKEVANVTPLQFGDSSQVQAGQPAIAIGTPEGLDFADSVTAGIISSPNRLMPIQDESTQQVLDSQLVIQTDAAINPGNSGGPLLNAAGQVIGINSSKIAAEGVEGMGFAIPSNEVKDIAEQIMKSGHAVHPSLGIEAYSLSSLPEQYWPNVPVHYGVWVRNVTSQQAQSAGLKDGDVIVSIDGKQVTDSAALRTYLFQKQVGQTVTLRVYRGSDQKTIKVPLSPMTTGDTSK